MYVIVGLGNPGKRYENTRHNMGFLVIDKLSEIINTKVDKIKHKALVGEGNIAGHKVLLVKPQTYMNLSGESVREILAYFKIDVANLIVVYDDIDIKQGKVRIRKFGSGGTHNGMKSIIQLLGSKDFPRVRVGIGRETKADIVDYVIGNISKEERKELEEGIEKSTQAVISIIEDGLDKAMNKHNTKEKDKEQNEKQL